MNDRMVIRVGEREFKMVQALATARASSVGDMADFMLRVADTRLRALKKYAAKQDKGANTDKRAKKAATAKTKAAKVKAKRKKQKAADLVLVERDT